PVVLSSSDIAVLTLRKELERYIKLLLLGNVETLISGVPMNFEDHDVGNENDKHSKDQNFVPAEENSSKTEELTLSNTPVIAIITH
ncbi:hypothetical protein EJB05_41281, partial [Eragrostis curvula]